jgi:hypothetical protein
MLTWLAAAAIQSGTVDLGRVFVKNEKLAYQVRAHVTAESRHLHLDTFLPQDLDVNYNFTATVSGMHADGIAVMHYLRPTMTVIVGETAFAPASTQVEKIGLDYTLSVSPLNEVLEEKDLSNRGLLWRGRGDGQQGSMIEPFIMDIHRLALFVGGVEDSLDFAPKLPLNPVKVGDTWKKTVGFQPQKLKGSDGQTAVQRLDFTYTYLGPMADDSGKTVLRVEGKLDFATDLADFTKQLGGGDQTIGKAPLHLSATVDFDLDPKTHDTLHAEADSTGGYEIFLSSDLENPQEEERFKARTTLDLTGKKILSAR